MANDLNQCNFIGRLGDDPDTRYLPDGKAVTNFSIAVGEQWREKDTGTKKERTTWVRMVCFGKLAEICGEYLTKGKLIFASGKFQTRSWEQNGEKKYMTEILLSQMIMLGGGQDKPKGNIVGEVPTDDDGDDIPF
jgi:single-strand DNA-binding protein